MSLFDRLFGWRRPPEQPVYAPPRADRVDVHRGFDVAANTDIVTGYRFCATMQLRTPLRVLRRHNEVHQGIGSEPPEIASEMWEGIWLPQAATFRELGLNVGEIMPTMASDIGPIPQDGGEYLAFLIAVRTVAEAEGSADQRRAAVASVINASQWRELVKKLGGRTAILDRLFPSFVASVPRMSAATAEGLTAAGYTTPAVIQRASDRELRSVKGVGPAAVTALRIAAGAADNQDGRFIDRVIR